MANCSVLSANSHKVELKSGDFLFGRKAGVVGRIKLKLGVLQGYF
jgi:hypothetical protein